MNLLNKFDEFQYSHRSLGFVVAVMRRYSNDHAGQQAALITYYSFTSLFPLLFLLSLFTGVLFNHYPSIANGLIKGATNYFPVMGDQLTKIAHSGHHSFGVMILTGLIAIYGARGAAIAFSNVVNDTWGVPAQDRTGFPKSWLKGLAIVFIGGGGLVLTAAATSWALGKGQGPIYGAIITGINIILLAGVFIAIMRISLPKHGRIRRISDGAVLMSVALTLLQLVGGIIVTHDLKHYTDIYTALFATTLGLLAWIYLQAQIIIYSLEVSVVVDSRLWPEKLFLD